MTALIISYPSNWKLTSPSKIDDSKYVSDMHINSCFYVCMNCKLQVEIFKIFFFYLGFIPCKAEQPLQRMELPEKETKKDYGIQEIYLERTYS